MIRFENGVRTNRILPLFLVEEDNVTHSSKRRSKNIIGRAPIVQVCAVSNLYTLAGSGQCTPEVPLDKPATSWDQA